MTGNKLTTAELVTRIAKAEEGTEAWHELARAMDERMTVNADDVEELDQFVEDWLGQNFKVDLDDLVGGDEYLNDHIDWDDALSGYVSTGDLESMEEEISRDVEMLVEGLDELRDRVESLLPKGGMLRRLKWILTGR